MLYRLTFVLVVALTCIPIATAVADPHWKLEPETTAPAKDLPLKIPAPVKAERRGTAGPIDDATWKGMQGSSWHPNMGCPSRDQLALLRIRYIDFFGEVQVGEMIVAKSVADDVLTVFAELHAKRFAIFSMRLVDKFSGNDNASMTANNTSAFNCRQTTGGGRLSEHSYGTAIDINPVQNPYVSGTLVMPTSGTAFGTPAARQRQRGVITNGDIVVKAFAKIGWKWGGAWSSPKDYQHFSKSGR